jgi:hypothetical protein
VSLSQEPQPETLIVAKPSRTSALAVMKLIQVDGQARLRPKARLIQGSAPSPSLTRAEVLCRRQGVSRALPAGSHRATCSAPIALSAGQARAMRRCKTRGVR